MMRVKTFIAPSLIHGLGLFAVEPIKAGTVVWSIGPEDLVVSFEEALTYEGAILEHLSRFAYSNRPRTDELILCADNGKFFNHSVLPNTVERYDEDRRYGVDVAAVQIPARTEITTDYRGFGPGLCRKFLDKMGIT